MTKVRVKPKMFRSSSLQKYNARNCLTTLNIVGYP